MLTIWGRKTSSNVQAVMWGVGELGLEHERLDIGHKYGGTDTEEFGRLNPNRLVPVIRDGDGPPIWESAAILRYLAAKYASAPFWPDDLDARSQVDKWAEWSKVNVTLRFTGPIFWRVVRTPAKDRDSVAIKAAVHSYEAALQIAVAQLENHDYLAGHDFTLADIIFGHLLYRYYTIEIERADLPAIARYYDRLCDRPAFRDHVMISYDELRAD